MSSRIIVDEIHGKTANASALTIDSNGRVGRTKVPAWFFITGDGQAANTALVADPVIWGQKVHDDDGAGGTMSNGSTSQITIPVSGLYWISYGGIKGSSSTVVGRMNMKKVSGTGDDIFIQARGEETASYAQMAASQVKYLYANSVYKITTADNGMWTGGNTLGSGFNDPYWTGYLVG